MADTAGQARDDEGVTTEKEERVREGVSPTATTAPEGREEGERLDATTLGEETRKETTKNTPASSGDAKGDDEDEGDAKGTTPEGLRGDAKGDVDAATTDRREIEPPPSSPRGATRNRPDDDEPAGVSHSRASKKPRLVWTPELHMRFMNAVNHLGIKHAVPKTILQLMNVEGMTRENVASHLQKYRLYLKRLAGVSPNAPLPADIMQRAQPYGAFPGNGAGLNVPFMPTMEQMHAGLPPTQPPPGAGHGTAVMAMGSFTAGMGGMGHAGGMGANTMRFAPFAGAQSGPAVQVALGVSDPYGAAAQQRAQQAYAAAGFGQFLNYMHGLQSSGYGAMPAGSPTQTTAPSGPGAGGDAVQAGGGQNADAAGAETKDT